MSDVELARSATETINKGSKSFAAAARLFDEDTRRGAVMLYAWCRHCDDVVDGQELGHRVGTGQGDPALALARLDTLTRAAYGDEPLVDPAFAGLREVARRFDLPIRYPLQHLVGFRMDVDERRYETLRDTLDYCYHVAGVVGVMMSHVMGVTAAPVLDRASDLGIAFQLTNIARDLVEDARNGRVYLPTQWLREAGISANAVADPRHRVALAGLAVRLVAEAEPYYASARIGIAFLPRRSAWAIATALGVYRQIGTEVARQGAAAWDGRVSTSTASKIRHVAAGAIASLDRTRRSGDRAGLYERPAAAA